MNFSSPNQPNFQDCCIWHKMHWRGLQVLWLYGSKWVQTYLWEKSFRLLLAGFPKSLPALLLIPVPLLFHNLQFCCSCHSGNWMCHVLSLALASTLSSIVLCCLSRWTCPSFFTNIKLGLVTGPSIAFAVAPSLFNGFMFLRRQLSLHTANFFTSL